MLFYVFHESRLLVFHRTVSKICRSTAFGERRLSMIGGAKGSGPKAVSS